jgi:hypothetical protein
VGNKVLYADEFDDIFSSAQTPDDSIDLRNSYIEKWVRAEVLFQHALNNLTDSLKDKTEQLDLYYRSLIKYEYEKALIEEKLDTAVSEEQLLAYYNQFKESFILKRPVTKAFYLCPANDLPKRENLGHWLEDLTVENMDSLQKYCIKYGVKHNLSAIKWYYLSDFLSELQLPANFEMPAPGQVVHVDDSLRTIYIKVEESAGPGSVMPLFLAGPTARDILKNTKKVDLVHRMEADVYNEAKRKNLFEIYK